MFHLLETPIRLRILTSHEEMEQTHEAHGTEGTGEPNAIERLRRASWHLHKPLSLSESILK